VPQHRRSIVVVLAVLALAGCTTGTEPEPEPHPSSTIPALQPVNRPLPDPAPPVTADEAPTYSGVGQVLVSGQCSGTLVDTGVPTGPAYVLTNGHCADGWGEDGNLVLVDEQAWDGASVKFGLVQGEDPGPELAVTSIAYSTMKRYDLAVLRLEGTLGAAQGLGLRALPIAVQAPATGDAVVNVGIPVQALDQDAWVQRAGSCTLGAQTDLLENVWYWQDAWGNDCPGIIQGSSGSPLLAGGEVVAVINTTTYGGFIRGGECFLGNPCELGPDGETMVDDRSYAQSVAGVAYCFDDAGVFALGGSCPLPAPGVRTPATNATVSLDAVRAGEADVRVALLSDRAVAVRYGLAPATSARPCADEATYTGETRVEGGTTLADGLVEPTTVAVELPAVEGRSLWCVTSGAAADASVVVLDVDGTPPVFTPTITVEDIGDALWVIPSFVNPELSNIQTKVGRDVDCSDADGFRDFLSTPIFVEKTDLPVTVCVLARDVAGNAAPMQQFRVTG